MRKTLLFILSAALLLSLFSCGKKEEAAPAGDQEIKTEGYSGDMTEYIDVPDLKDVRVSDAEVEKEWQAVSLKVRLDSTFYEKCTDPGAAVEIYDSVNIDYKISQSDTNAFTTAVKNAISQSGYDVIIGSGTLIGAYSSPDGKDLDTKSFEEQLIGAKSGEDITVVITFPADFSIADSEGDSDRLAGARCALDVHINSISRGEVPELTNSLILKYTTNKYTTVDEYRDFVYGYYRSLFAYEEFMSLVTLKKYPEDELYKARLTYINDMIKESYPTAKLDEEDIRTLYDMLYNEADSYARQAVFERVVLEYLFSVCGITLTESAYLDMLTSDYTASYVDYYMRYGISTMSDYEEYFGKDNLVLQYKYQKMLDVLPSLVTLTE